MNRCRLACFIWKKVNSRLYFTLLCLAMLSACGFQLRGQQNYAFKRITITGGAPFIVARLARIIEAGSDTAVVTQAGKPEVRLLLSEGQGQNPLSLNRRNEVVEYELTYRLAYSLTSADDGRSLANGEIVLNRTMTFGTKVVPAKQQEADVLYVDMQNDAANQLISRLAAVRWPFPPTPPGQAVPLSQSCKPCVTPG